MSVIMTHADRMSKTVAKELKNVGSEFTNLADVIAKSNDATGRMVLFGFLFPQLSFIIMYFAFVSLISFLF